MSKVDIRVGHLPDPYRLDIAYSEGQPVGEVENIEFSRPEPDRLRPYIEGFLRGEAVSLNAHLVDSAGCGVAEC